ncbi:ABC transporter substrate-binding protein, partial [Hydrogenophaga sp.]|uniref:ABC transporter substrate-binding protein n=1 Tax=Hydrogenophaga sp. TaxID=1904254 RepID=UPI0035663DE3
PLSINFIKQYAQAGLKNIPLFGPAPLADEQVIPAVGEPMLDVTSSGHWSLDLNTEANKQFSAAFLKENGKAAELASEQGYTTALVLDAAIKAVKGNIEDKVAFRKALEAVKVEAPRGPFRFNVDHSPVQNVYLRKVTKDAKGELENTTLKTIATAHSVNDAASCRM